MAAWLDENADANTPLDGCERFWPSDRRTSDRCICLRLPRLFRHGQQGLSHRCSSRPAARRLPVRALVPTGSSRPLVKDQGRAKRGDALSLPLLCPFIARTETAAPESGYDLRNDGQSPFAAVEPIRGKRRVPERTKPPMGICRATDGDRHRVKRFRSEAPAAGRRPG
jgi:hypothetical protein